MAAPTVAYIGNSAPTDTGSETIASSSWVTGNTILVLGMTEDQGTSLGTPAATGLSFNALSGLPTTTGSSCKGYGWSAVAASDGTSTITATGSFRQVIAAWRISGSDGLGTPVKLTDTAKVVSLTRGQANSCIACIIGDWSADTDVTVTSDPSGGTVRSAAQAGSYYTEFIVDWPDQGSTGSTNYGVAGASGTGTLTKIAVEILGTGAAPQQLRPDADTTTTGWSTAPLYSKINDESDATVITATLA